MRIADFERIPLGTWVIYEGRRYVMVDRIKRTHEAIIATDREGGSRATIRCSEVEVANRQKQLAN